MIFRKVSLGAVIISLALLLSACVEVKGDISINSAARFNGELTYTLDKSFAAAAGIPDLAALNSEASNSEDPIDFCLGVPFIEDATNYILKCSLKDALAQSGDITASVVGSSIVFRYKANLDATSDQTNFGSVSLTVRFLDPVISYKENKVGLVKKVDNYTYQISGYATEPIDIEITANCSSRCGVPTSLRAIDEAALATATEEANKAIEAANQAAEAAAAELRAKQAADAKAAADLKAQQEAAEKAAADKAAAELKAKQEADAIAAAELKAKQEADAKAAASAIIQLQAEVKAIAEKIQAATDKTVPSTLAQLEAEIKAIAEKIEKTGDNSVTDQKAAADKAAAELKAKQEAAVKVAAELKAAAEKAAADLKAAADKAAAEKVLADAKAAAAKILAAAKAKAAAAKKKTTITCVKGKLTKKVTAVKPVCPKGYTKKK
jgi:hypothetical protein